MRIVFPHSDYQVFDKFIKLWVSKMTYHFYSVGNPGSVGQGWTWEMANGSNQRSSRSRSGGSRIGCCFHRFYGDVCTAQSKYFYLSAISLKRKHRPWGASTRTRACGRCLQATCPFQRSASLPHVERTLHLDQERGVKRCAKKKLWAVEKELCTNEIKKKCTMRRK